MTNKKNINVSLQPIGTVLTVQCGTPLKDILHVYGIEFPCGGKGTCGSCKVKILKGAIPLSNDHRSKLVKLRLPEHMRLSCMSEVNQDVTLELSQFESVILTDNTTFNITPATGHAIAVDLGTTTIVAQLLDLSSGHVLNVATDRNQQGKYGADIMSRIEYALDETHAESLKNLIRNQILEMVQWLVEGHDINLCNITLVGNTAMHHLFCGLNVKPLSFFPFESPNLGLQHFTPEMIEWALPKEMNITFMPSIGSFVGSDILAGIFASGIHKGKAYKALIDLGTNGEIVIGNNEGIICASTAAGPAFEGARITMGMTAITGAISSVRFEDGNFNNHTIGNVKPTGICGSGIIDAISVFLDENMIDEFGQIRADSDVIFLEDKVFVNQQDIREIQLAKAAIAAGIDILCQQLGIKKENIETLYIAGGFGNYIHIPNTRKIGLINLPEEKIKKAGNTALIGAKMFLFMEQQEIKDVLKITRHFNLESDPEFQELFVQNMNF